MKLVKNYVLSNRSHIFGVCRACGLTSASAGDLLTWMVKVEETNDVKFVVNELKRRMMDLLDPSRRYYRYHGDGTWVGPFRPISRLAKKSRKGFRNALKILRLYGIFHAPEATQEDYVLESKRLSVTEDSNPNFSLLIPAVFPTNATVREFDSSYPLSSTKVPLDTGSLPQYEVPPCLHIESLDSFPALVSLFHGFFTDLVGGAMPQKEHFDALIARGPDRIGNAIILNKDGGLKQRLIANVFPILQLGLSRLHNSLYELLKKLPNCHVFGQDEGVAWAIEQLKGGKKLSSIDLEKATDNIPLEPQIDLVLRLFPKLGVDIALFHRAARSQFKTPFNATNITWHRGHPMGLKGSFPLFTLFLYALYSKHTDTFAIVGDDLIVDAEATESVIKDMESLGIPINRFKSLFGSTLGEFCGRLFDKNGDLKVYKASIQKDEADPLGLFRQYGSRAFRFIYRNTKRVRVKQLIRMSSLASNDWEKLSFFLSDLQAERLKGLRRGFPQGKAPELVRYAIYASFPDFQLGNLLRFDGLKSMSFQQNLDCNLKGYELKFKDTDPYPLLIKAWKFLENPPEKLQIGQLARLSFPPGDDEGYLALMDKLRIKDLADFERLQVSNANSRRKLRKQFEERILPLVHLERLLRLYDRAMANLNLALRIATRA